MSAKPRRNLATKRKAVILARDGYRCQYCGLTRADGAILEVDHKVAASKGGSDRMSNLITSCRECNRSKRDKRLEIPPLKKPERYIVNADGSITSICEKGTTAKDIARSLVGHPDECLSCGEVAMNRVVWTSPFLVGRENKQRSLIYPLCDDCARRLLVDGEDAIGHSLDDKLIEIAKKATHVRLVESFDITTGAST